MSEPNRSAQTEAILARIRAMHRGRAAWEFQRKRGETPGQARGRLWLDDLIKRPREPWSSQAPTGTG